MFLLNAPPTREFLKYTLSGRIHCKTSQVIHVHIVRTFVKGYRKLLNELRSRDRLIVYRLDRLTRNSFDFADLWRGYIQRKQICFVSLTENYDTTTADGMLQIKLRVDIADFEREIIRTRTREALAEKRRQGLVISRYIPYGYAKRGKHLEPIE